jgi:hypothetical protein
MTAQIEGRPDDEVHASFEFVVVPERDQWAIAHDDRPVALLVLEGEWVDQLYVDPPSRLDMKFSVSVAQPNQRRAQGRQVADHERATASDGVVRGVYEHVVSRHVDERQARAVDVHERFVSVVDGVVQVGVE